jgi:hypothetical protein
MSDITLTCDESPLNWPPNVDLADVSVTKTSAIRFFPSEPGPLQILTRRQGGGEGDGVNILESNTVGAEYRGQQYNLDEVIFQTPGIHIFPGMTSPYPAELHVHMETAPNVVPQRSITIVVPASHLIDGPGEAYFAAAQAQPDPAAVRPTLASAIAPVSDVLQIRGPDLRGRTAANPTTEACTSLDEHIFLFVLTVSHIRAADLDRIYTQGSLSTDKRDLPADPLPLGKKVSADRLLRISTRASPGIRSGSGSGSGGITTTGDKELECKPVKVVNGRDVIDENGAPLDVYKLLGISGETLPDGSDTSATVMAAGSYILTFLGLLFGLLIADAICTSFVWKWWFLPGTIVEEPAKIWLFLFIALSASAGVQQIGS